MITYDMVKSGYETGLVALILDPHNGRIACSIGDYWFYFGGHTAEEYTSVDAYKRDIPADDIVKEIYDVLDAFQKEDAFQDEYLYYEAFLRERMHDDVEKQMHEIIAEVGDWFGTFSEVGSQIQIDNGWEVFAYNSPREALQDWIYDMISGDARDWNPEIQFLMANGIKVEGVRVVEGKDDKVRYMAVIDYPLSNGKTRHLSAGTFATPQAAYSALLAAQILRKECLAANMSLVDFTAKLKDLRAEGKTVKNANTSKKNARAQEKQKLDERKAALEKEERAARRERLGIKEAEKPASQVGNRRYARGRAYVPDRFTNPENAEAATAAALAESENAGAIDLSVEEEVIAAAEVAEAVEEVILPEETEGSEEE